MPEATATATTASSTQPAASGRPPRRHPRNRGPARDPTAQDGTERPPRAQQPRRPPADPQAAGQVGEGDAKPNPNRRRRNNKKKPAASDAGSVNGQGESNAGSGTDGPRQQRSRKAQFGAKLTGSGNDAQSAGASSHAHAKYQAVTHPGATDLTNRLAQSLSTPPYPDCAICFNPLRPEQPTWSCSPSFEATACCWTSFHLKCLRAWALKSTKETREAFRARNDDSEGEWRCPGCQTKRHVVPQAYMCFCGAVNDPKPNRLSTPHSCGNPCSRKRLTCEHACPLPCHPGPCPPCVTTVQKPCFCNKTTLSFRCAHFATVPPPSMSCGSVCNKPLSCGKHRCEATCHAGNCEPCAELEYVQCYCGQTRKEVACGQGVSKSCVVGIGSDAVEWEGRFECDAICARPFLCGVHSCKRTCHPPSPLPIPCPMDPSIVTHCPCGKTILGRTRTKCTDPIPTCDSTCAKPLATCNHACSSPCHLGTCPPCNIPIAVPCRCGETTRYIACSERQRDLQDGVDVLCDKVCKTLRLCGRHECTRVCCPAHNLRPKGAKGKKKAQAAMDDALEGMEVAWHTCEFLCGKLLTCGLHQCEEPDHRGPCPPCLRSSFDEMMCKCGRTIIQPPIPCGTKIVCTYPCSEPPPPCGHPKTPHACHETGSCPPCPFLTAKACACGKATVPNIRCSQEKVSCGKACGKPMNCGYHLCERVCHGDECGECHAVCGKPRKHCLPARHPCTMPCHAPAACDESEPCQERVWASCECGRIQQPVLCGRSASSTAAGRDSQKLDCSQDCAIAKRNARLAEALGISPARTADKTAVTYSPELLQFAKANVKFLALVEKTFADFVASDKKSQVLPEMHESRRTFVISLAAIYRMDTALVDVEPHQSVQLVRRIDTRVPHPLLSQLAGPPPPPTPSRLVDMRASQKAAPAPLHRAGTPSSSSAKPGGAWASVVAATPSPAAPSPSTSTSRLTALPRSNSSSSVPRRSPAPPTTSWEDDV
ncbi:hypothetical protein EXIGLDRAFT_667828 [Exidia glandulosa HHB12029]|uniref:NF-X1-type domain-containing protein n=1 Tax=Exidia glandulosa HHB12029 TaxID=1314781 RepID=A0A165MZQ7_EXIGL|nr:hypothetical protein EXIGLDRAFT_667828 [Exidia glandulosa HHB12029]